MSAKVERYAAFLVTYLPMLQSVREFINPSDVKSRLSPLLSSLEYAQRRPGCVLEFGVFKGDSIRMCAGKFPDRQYYGFDSFEGFPDDGRVDWQQDFSVGGNLPQVPDNVKLFKGYFCDTLPGFLDNLKEKVSVVNIDCDIYSSTKDIFNNLRDKGHIEPGLVMSFDELINYNGYVWNEMLALFELLEETGLSIKWISCHNRVRTIEETVLLSRSNSHPKWAEDVKSGLRQQASLVLEEGPLDYSILEYPHCRERIGMIVDYLQKDKRAHLLA